LTEAVASTARRDAPTAPVIGVGPEEIADGTLVRCLLNAIKLANLVESVDAGREAAVEAEDLTLNDSGKGQVIKKFSELLPNVSVAVFTQALVVKTVYLCDLPALVVTSKDGDSVLEADLKCDEKRHCLHRVVATVDVVTHEEVVRVGWLPSNLE